jgi:hypothetical protein
MLGRLVPGVGGVQDAAKYATSNLNPILRVPFEIGTGRDAFTGREIGNGAEITWRGQIANQIRPVREAPKVARAFREQGVGAGLARTALGGRVQPMDDERMRVSRLAEYRKEEEQIRGGLRRATRNENRAQSVVYRAKLLRLYSDMVAAGFADEVPSGMRGQVERLQQQPA